jgi:hypothetical protein
MRAARRRYGPRPRRSVDQPDVTLRVVANPRALGEIQPRRKGRGFLLDGRRDRQGRRAVQPVTATCFAPSHMSTRPPPRMVVPRCCRRPPRPARDGTHETGEAATPGWAEVYSPGPRLDGSSRSPSPVSRRTQVWTPITQRTFAPSAHCARRRASRSKASGLGACARDAAKFRASVWRAETFRSTAGFRTGRG